MARQNIAMPNSLAAHSSKPRCLYVAFMFTENRGLLLLIWLKIIMALNHVTTRRLAIPLPTHR
jgi:hypothetical protein